MTADLRRYSRANTVSSAAAVKTSAWSQISRGSLRSPAPPAVEETLLCVHVRRVGEELFI